MIVSVKSEVDNRSFLYQLIRTLLNHGSILVLSNNNCVERLIDNEESSTFRNNVCIVEKDDSSDEIMQKYGYANDDFNFIIADNTGSVEYDVMFLVMTAEQEHLKQELDELLDKEDRRKVFAVYLGDRPKTVNGKQSKEPAMEEYDPAAKFRVLEEGVKAEKREMSVVAIPYLTFDEIESVESLHVFTEVNQKLVPILLEAFNDVIGMTKRNFGEELRVKDENRNCDTAEYNWG